MEKELIVYRDEIEKRNNIVVDIRYFCRIFLFEY